MALGLDLAPVHLDERARDVEADSAARTLGREVALVDPGEDVARDPSARVHDAHPHPAAVDTGE